MDSSEAGGHGPHLTRRPARGRFLARRPSDLRKGPPWHRLAYIIRALPAAIQAQVEELGCPPGARVLDFGCADSPYRGLFPTEADYVRADLPGNPEADLDIAPDGTLPIDDESFDFVISTQVLEHVEDPEAYLRESHRVLKKGGQILISTHGIMVYHPDPVDLWRWTCEGLRHALGAAGFKVERFRGVMGLAATGLQLVQDSLYFRVPALARPALALLIQSLIAIADRFESRESRNLNALVFVAIARKP